MAGRKKESVLTNIDTYTVNSVSGLNLREIPTRDSAVMRILKDGEIVAIDNSAEAPDGWKAVVGGGFVMGKYLKQ